MIVLLGGEKGGTGKTTLAVNLAAFRVQDGHDVLLIDTDRQGSAAFWAQIRSEKNSLPNVPCVQIFGKALPKDVMDLSRRYEDIVIDAGGRDSMEMRYSLGVANKIIVPIQPSQFDLNTLTQMSQLIEQAQALNPELEAYVKINRASTHPGVTDAEEAKYVVSEFEHLKLMPTVVRERVAYQRCVREGISVGEVNLPDSKAVSEIQCFYEEVFS